MYFLFCGVVVVCTGKYPEFCVMFVLVRPLKLSVKFKSLTVTESSADIEPKKILILARIDSHS